MIQTVFSNATRAYCLLAAASARMQYIHRPCHHSLSEARNPAHGYAEKALRSLSEKLNDGLEWGEEEAIDVLFLAAYEVFCENEVSARRHLGAARRLYRGRIENSFVKRLQANLEVLVVKSLEGRVLNIG